MWPWGSKQKKEVVLIKTEEESVYVLGTTGPSGRLFVHAYRTADAALDAQEQVRKSNRRCATWIIRLKVNDVPVSSDFTKEI